MSEEGVLDNQDANVDCSNHTTQDFSTRQVKRPSTVEAASKQGRMKGYSVVPTVHTDNTGPGPHCGP